MFNESAIAAALDEALGNASLIDRYVSANKRLFDDDDLEIVKSWKVALTDHFITFQHAGKVLLLSENRLYHVTDSAHLVVGIGGCTTE